MLDRTSPVRPDRPSVPPGRDSVDRTCGPRRSLTDALDREWLRLRCRPSSLRRLRSVHTDEPDLDRWASDRLGSARDLDDVVALTHRRLGADGDRLLRWLLLAASSEPLAARIVLQRLLPLAISAAARWTAVDGTGPPVDEVITASMVAILRADRSTDRAHLAPRLVGAAVQDALRTPRRRRRTTAEVSSGNLRFELTAAPSPELDPLVAVTRLLHAGTAAGVDPDLLDVARRLARGESTSRIAEASGCTDRTIRNRRRRLAEWARAELDPSWADWADPLTGVEARAGRSAA